MKVVLLVGSVDEGKALVRLAGLAMADVVIPRTGTAVDGLGLHSEDLIAEFPSWLYVPAARRRDVERVLLMSVAKAGGDVPWVRLGQE